MKILIIAPRTRTLIGFRRDMIKEMVLNGHEVVAIGPEPGFENEIAALGAKFILLPFNKNSIGFLHDYRYYNNLVDIILSEKPEIVFSYTIKPVVYGSLAAKKAMVPFVYSMISGLGSIYSANNDFKTLGLRKITDALYRRAFRCCEKVFFQNPDDVTDFNSRGLLKSSKCVLVNGSGINMEQFYPVPLPKTPIFLMIGRIIREKGILDYLEAARIVKKKYPHVRLQLLGPFDSKMGSISMDQIRPYVDDESIEYLGFAKNVQQYIAASSVFVLPSIYREGVPHSILEAMAMGRAIITTDGPGCKETVINGVNGYLVPQNDSRTLASAMERLIVNPELRESMGQESLRYCKEKFAVEKVNQILLKTMGLT